MKSTGTRTVTLRAVAALAAFAVTIGVAVGVAVTQRGTASVSAAEALAVCDRDGTYDFECVAQTIDQVTVDNAGTFALGVLDVVRDHPELADDCHTIMHTLGRHVADDVTSIAAELATTWEPCGYGLLHGVFESQQIPGDVTAAGAEVAQLCNVGTIPTVARLLGECFHALGHAIYDTFATLDEAVSVCDAAFPATNAANTPSRIGCYSGLAMKERDDVLIRVYNGEVVGPTVEEFERVAAACSRGGEEFAIACAPGFVQIATEFGADHIRPFLQWCGNLTQIGSQQCWQQAGVYMGHFRAKFASLAQSVDLCAPGAAEAVDACRTSLVEGLLNRGEERQSAIGQVCDAYRVARLEDSARLCELITRQFS